MSETQVASRHTPEDICKMMGGLTRTQAMAILADKGLREGDSDPFAGYERKQVRLSEHNYLHPQLKDFYFHELVWDTPHAVVGVEPMVKYRTFEWRPKQYAFDHWVHLYMGGEQGRQVSCGYRQTYSWFEWELKGEVNY